MTNPIIEYSPNGNKRFEKYYLNGHYHRDPLVGPALISYYSDGNKKLEHYVVNGKWHRDLTIGPARIWYDKDGKIIWKEYRVNGKLHNPYGPTFINYEYDIYDWHLNDKEYTNEVNEYLDKHNLSWQDMSQADFNIMWIQII